MLKSQETIYLLQVCFSFLIFIMKIEIIQCYLSSDKESQMNVKNLLKMEVYFSCAHIKNVLKEDNKLH